MESQTESLDDVRVSRVGTTIYIHTNGRTLGLTQPMAEQLAELLAALLDTIPKLEDL